MTSFWEEDQNPPPDVLIAGVRVKLGSRVRLHPRKGADIFDMILAGKSAVVESIEQDYDNNIQVAVTLDDDPGKDLGWQKQPGHRFFFSVDEIEPLPEERT